MCSVKVDLKNMANLSEFQKQKLLHVFSTFYDINHDGVVEWADFELDVAKLSNLLHWTEGSEQRKKAETTLHAIWEDLRKFADKNADEKISKEEWLCMWASLIQKDKAHLPDWVNRYMEFMFSVNDGNGDDVIDVDEYSSVFTKYGISVADCHAAFKNITQNGAIKLTLEEYKKLWEEYFLSADPKARGNSLFGHL